MKKNLLLCVIVMIASTGCKKLHPTKTSPPSTITNIIGSVTDVQTVRTPYIELFLKIMDQNNTPILDFQIGDFAVTENNTPVPIDEITYSRIPLSVVLVLDRSGSMGWLSNGATPYVQLNQAVNGFIDGLSAIDQVKIIDFGSTVEVRNDFTNDKTALKNIINAHSDEMGGTSLWEAAGIGVREVQEGFGYKLLLVMTDGGDGGFGSEFPTVGSVITYANSFNQIVYTIGYGTSSDINLQTLALNTGGSFYTASSASELTAIYSSFIPSAVDHALLHYRTRQNGSKDVEVFLNYGVFSKKFTYKYSS